MSHTFVRRFRRAAIAALVLGASAAPATASAACTKTWIAQAGDWTTAEAWSPVGVPGPADDVCLPASGNYVVTVPAIAGGGALVHSFAVGGTGIGRPTLEIIGASVPSDGITQQYAALTATAGGTIAANGIVELEATDGGSTATPGERAGGGATLAGGPITNLGEIVALSASTNGRRDHLRASVTNGASGVLRIASGLLDTDDGSTFQNLGTVLANDTGVWLITASPAFGGVPSRMINSGVVTTTGRVQTLDGSWTQAGGVVSGAAIDLQDSLLDYEGGTGSFTFLPDADPTPSRLAGEIPFQQTVSVVGATVQLQAPQVTNSGTLLLSPGAVSGTTLLTGAPLANEGAIEVAANAAAAVAGASYLHVDVTNAGTFEVDAGSTLVQDAGTLFRNSFILAIDPGGRWRLSSGPANGTRSRLESVGDSSKLALVIGTHATGVIDVGPGGELDATGELDPMLETGVTPFPGQTYRAIENTGGTIAPLARTFAGGAAILVSANGSVAFRYGLLVSQPHLQRGGFSLHVTCPSTSPPCGRSMITAIALRQVWRTVGKGARRTRVQGSVPIVVGSATIMPLSGESRLVRVRLNASGRALIVGRRTLAITISVTSQGHSLLHRIEHVRT